MTNEVNEGSDLVIKMIFVAIFLVVVLLAVVYIINALNSSNQNAGTIISNDVTNESTYYQDIAPNTVYNLSANSLVGSTCSISSITDFDGNLIDPSNYTVNNCQVTFK